VLGEVKLESAETPEATTVSGEVKLESSETPEATTVSDKINLKFPETLEAMTTSLKDRLLLLKEYWKETNSALVSWGNQTKQLFFHPENALEEIKWQIKKHWSIPRKFYWLQINGRHESQITDWPRESSIEIKIRGLGAGGFDDPEFPDDDVFDPYEEPGGGPLKKRKKHPKGTIKVNILERTYRIGNALTFREAYEKCSRRDCDADEFWLPSGKRADADCKMRCYFPPSLETIRVIDEVVSHDPEKMKKGWIGCLKLSLKGKSTMFRTPGHLRRPSMLMR
jgi:hypothetical protein